MGCLARKCAIRSFSGVSGRSSHRMRPRWPVFGASNSPVRRTRKGILRVEIPVQENIPGNIPVQENIPRNIPARGLQKVLQFQGLTKNIPNIPDIPGMSGMRMDAPICLCT